jgi:hypothetical protein
VSHLPEYTSLDTSRSSPHSRSASTLLTTHVPTLHSRPSLTPFTPALHCRLSLCRPSALHSATLHPSFRRPSPFTPALHSATLHPATLHPAFHRSSPVTPPPVTLALHSAALHSRSSQRRPSPFNPSLLTVALHSAALHRSLRHPPSLPHPPLPPFALPPFTLIPPLFTRHLLKEARRVRRLGEVLSSNVQRRAEGRVIFRAWLSTKSYTQCCGEELW